MLDDLRALVEFAQAGSIARAADRLFRTPSAITRQVQTLEAALAPSARPLGKAAASELARFQGSNKREICCSGRNLEALTEKYAVERTYR